MRASGILMHISSLPSPYGIGTFGKEAYAFADFLAAAGQKYWQILPLGPTGYGDSPYQTASAFAGNPYFIDLDMLVEDGLLEKAEVTAPDWGRDAEHADYGALYTHRGALLRKAFERGWDRDRVEVSVFRAENAAWLESYALFTAAKARFGMKPWIEWEDEELRLRTDDAVLAKYTEELREDIDFCVYTQYLFYRQWNALRDYIHEKGILVIGDVPIYVPLDSADVWSAREQFQLEDDGRPTEVAGVPPDYFSEDGQLWGNPLYDWEGMKEDGFTWWMKRLRAASKLYDMVRIDHFRGLESYWAVPYGDETAKNGHWKPGPGKEFITAIKTEFPDMPVIAEDLGVLTHEVGDLLEFSGFPGMKVLQFGCDPDNNYLPHKQPRNCVCYIGTHDNDTLAQWLESVPTENLAFAKEYFGLNHEEGYANGILRGGMSAPADLFIAQMQDWLGLGAESHMNNPGILGGNWCWRMKKGAATPALAKKILRMTKLYGR